MGWNSFPIFLYDLDLLVFCKGFQVVLRVGSRAGEVIFQPVRAKVMYCAVENISYHDPLEEGYGDPSLDCGISQPHFP